MECREHVEAANNVGNDGDDHQQLGNTSTREAVNAGACALLYSVVRALDFTDIIVSRDDVEVDGELVGTDTFELSIGVDVADEETASGVELDDCLEFREDSGMFAIRDGGDGTELKITEDRVKKWVTLDEEEVNTEDYIAVVGADVRQKGNDIERQYAGADPVRVVLPLREAMSGP